MAPGSGPLPPFSFTTLFPSSLSLSLECGNVYMLVDLLPSLFAQYYTLYYSNANTKLYAPVDRPKLYATPRLLTARIIIRRGSDHSPQQQGTRPFRLCPRSPYYLQREHFAVALITALEKGGQYRTPRTPTSNHYYYPTTTTRFPFFAFNRVNTVLFFFCNPVECKRQGCFSFFAFRSVFSCSHA